MQNIVDGPFSPVIGNGLKCRCPHCGEGKLYGRYLKIVDNCGNCGLELGLARADELPAYVAITIVGHVLVMGITYLQAGGGGVGPWVYLAGLMALAIVLPLILLPIDPGRRRRAALGAARAWLLVGK